MEEGLKGYLNRSLKVSTFSCLDSGGPAEEVLEGNDIHN